MLKALERLLCRHQFGWSERRQAEVCYRCGLSRKVRAGRKDADERPV